MNPYEVLGISSSATEDEIKSAYRREAMKSHPDKTGGDSTRFHEVQNAYDALTKQKQRQTHSFDFNDIFEQQFADMFAQFRGHYQAPRNSDVQVTAQISLEQAFTGLPIELNTNTGKIKVDIPAGVSNSQRIRVPGAGNNHDANYPPGDLYIFISIQPHPKFRRHISDLVMDAEISTISAIIGCTTTVTNIDGEVINVDIPAGTQFGDVLHIPNKGMPIIKSDRRGTLHIQIGLKTPTNLTENQLEIIRQLEKTL